MFHTSWYFRCNTFWSQPRYLKDCVALFGPGRQAWPNHALPLQLAKALDEDICHCKSYTLHYIADRKDQSVFYSFKPKEFVALFFLLFTTLAGKFKEQTWNKSDHELQNVNMLFFITGFLVCFAGERLQHSIRNEGMNMKIKDNSVAASWSSLICFNMKLRTTDLKTQPRNRVANKI